VKINNTLQLEFNFRYRGRTDPDLRDNLLGILKRNRGKIARRVGDQNVDDVVQDSALYILKTIDKDITIRKPANFVGRVVFGKSIDNYRRESRYIPRGDIDTYIGVHNPWPKVDIAIDAMSSTLSKELSMDIEELTESVGTSNSNTSKILHIDNYIIIVGSMLVYNKKLESLLCGDKQPDLLTTWVRKDSKRMIVADRCLKIGLLKAFEDDLKTLSKLGAMGHVDVVLPGQECIQYSISPNGMGKHPCKFSRL